MAQSMIYKRVTAAASAPLSQDIRVVSVKSQASASLKKSTLHSDLYSRNSMKCPSSLSRMVRRSGVEKLPHTLSFNASRTQFFSSRWLELKRCHDMHPSLPSPKQRGMVTASLPGAGSVKLAASFFTLATAIVIPFYTVMILAPKWEWTVKMMRSEIPYFILGAGYIYLLALSWTPETLGLMFASKYWLPELAGITKMFSSTMTVASAWLHLLAVDLFAGRHMFLDGAKHNIETRHSLVLCLMMCPIGIFSHLITKNLTLYMRRRDETMKTIEHPPY
ncbi:hypothetical protein R1flu_029209 [Riccia fluitans]|uniref:Neoxanthin synthase n=1 Tax=Riccia fluitans TaxID=41844 RepID=A0ABD1XRR9_9MARC